MTRYSDLYTNNYLPNIKYVKKTPKKTIVIKIKFLIFVLQTSLILLVEFIKNIKHQD